MKRSKVNCKQVSIVIFLAFVTCSAVAQGGMQGWFEDFEDGSSPFGFTLDEIQGTSIKTEDINLDESDAAKGERSAYLSESWECVSRELGFEEGIVTLWFYDSNYTGYESNAIRLRTEEDTPETPGWPLDYLTVELKGQRSGHGGGAIEYYYVNRPDPEGGGMGVEFGKDLISGDYVQRVTEAWNEVSFTIVNGKTHASINGTPTDIEVESPLTHLELLCRSGWYKTRGGEAKAMLWDNIFASPLIHAAGFERCPEWMTLQNGDCEFSALPDDLFVPLVGTTEAARLSEPETELSCSWNVEQGAIEIWFWDPYRTDAGFKDIITLSNTDNESEFLQVVAYSQVMGNTSQSYYVKTHNTSMGGTFKVPRSHGWHRLLFRKVNDCLSVSVDGVPADDETAVWNDPPGKLTVALQTGTPSYANGGSIWYGRILITGIPKTSIQQWKSH